MQKTRIVEEKTASWTLSETDSGKVFEIGATDVVATLPALSGLGGRSIEYKFIVTTVSATTGFSISPAAADSINNGTDNKDLINTAATDAVGDCVTVHSDANGVTWLAVVNAGTWAAEA